MNLNDAITAVEAALAGYTQATTTVANDTSAIAPLQAKLDAANAQIATDTQALGASATALNYSLQDLSTAALAAVVPAPTPPAASTPPAQTAANTGTMTGIL